MDSSGQNKLTIGWVGAGHMGYPMAERLAKAECNLSVWNRTRAKAEPLAGNGVTIVDTPQQIAVCDVVFTMVSTGADLQEVLLGPQGVLSARTTPKIVVDCSSISAEESQRIREQLEPLGIAYVSAPVSGNGQCVRAGKLAVVASGPKKTFERVAPYLEIIGGLGVTYVGEGELARVVKICHNVFLAVVTQSLAEITILAQKSGIKRSAFLGFINRSVMGSIFTQYKTPGWVNKDYSVTFTPELLRKDMDLGLGLARHHEVPMPTASTTRDLVQASMGHGNRQDVDFGIILEYMAQCAGVTIEPENVSVSNGLEVDTAA